MNEFLDEAKREIAAGGRAEINSHQGATGTTLQLAIQSDELAKEKNAAGLYVMTVYSRDKADKVPLSSSSIDRAHASEMLKSGAEYVGRDDLHPDLPAYAP